MKNLIHCLSFFLLCTMLFSCAEKSLPPSVLLELEGVERAMFDATSAGDSAAFRKICGIDYHTINANGEAHDLEETIPFVPRFKGSVSQLSEQSQRVFGNFVIRSGRLKAFMGGNQVAEALYTSGWIYRDNRWQFVHWQGTLTGMSIEPLLGKAMIEPPPAN